MKKLQKLSLEKINLEDKSITREDLISLRGGAGYSGATYTGCTATTKSDGKKAADCTDGYLD